MTDIFDGMMVILAFYTLNFFHPGPLLFANWQQPVETIAVQADQETLERLRTELPLPPGYVDDGAVFRAAASTGSPGGGQASAVEIVRFRSSGPALLEVAEVFADGEVPISSPAGVPVEVEGWDEVWFEPGFRTSFLRARLDDSSFLELRHHDVAFLFEVLGTVERR